MLTVPASPHRLRPQRATAAGAAWRFFWAGTACCYALVLLRLADVGPTAALAVGFASFHGGLAASLLALLRGLQRGSAAALFANGLPVGMFWLALWSVPAFFARFQ